MIIIHNVRETKSLMAYDVLMLSLVDDKKSNKMLTINDNRILTERRSYLFYFYGMPISFIRTKSIKYKYKYKNFEKFLGNDHIAISEKKYYKQLKECSDSTHCK